MKLSALRNFLGLPVLACMSSLAWSAPLQQVPLLTVTTNFPAGYRATLKAEFDPHSGRLIDARYDDGHPPDEVYTTDQIIKGFRLLQIDELDMRIIGVSAPHLDPETGGILELTFKRKIMGNDFRKVAFQATFAKDTQGRKTIALQVHPAFRDRCPGLIDQMDVKVDTLLGVPNTIEQITLKNKGRIACQITSGDLPSAPRPN